MSGIHTSYEYKITSDPALMDRVYGTTPKIREILNNNFLKLDKKSIIEKLLNDIEKYPTIPQFKQQLATAYMLQKLSKKATECNHWLYKEHPTYLFALLNKAFDKYNQKNYEGMLEFLGNDLQLESLYPDRKEFHIDEVMNYLSACAIYRNATEPDNVQKDIILEVMEELDEESAVLERTIDTIEKYNIETASEWMSSLRAKEKHVETVFAQSIPKSNVAPSFNNLLFNELYKAYGDIDQSIITEILNLPNNVINSECQKIINDSIARFHFFNTNKDENTFFLIHALLILGETGNRDNLPLFLQILRQSEDYYELYLGDILTEIAWSALYKISSNDISLLFQFLIEPNKYVFCKTVVTRVLEEFVLNNVLPKEKLIKEYVELLHFFLANKNNTSIIDSYIVADIVSFLVDLKAQEHYPLLQKMYEEELVSIMAVGTYNELMYRKEKYPVKTADKLDNIFEIYNNIAGWQSNDTEDDYDDYEEVLPIRTEPKIGRNDNCPCGSEKKFKKCCLDKGIY
jgi:Protein of unknown function (DUF1186)/SEC-C motif